MKSEYIGKVVSKEGGTVVLSGEVNDPRGYTHFVQLTDESGDLAELNDVIARVVKKLKCKKWECNLGVRHDWTEAETDKEKLEAIDGIRGIYKDWEKAVIEGKLEPWEIEEINRRFGKRLQFRPRES